MKSYRKIKLFKFADFESYEECQESANDYYKEVAIDGWYCDLIMNTDYIAVILPKVVGMYGSREIPIRNTKIDLDKVIKSEPIAVDQYGNVNDKNKKD